MAHTYKIFIEHAGYERFETQYYLSPTSTGNVTAYMCPQLEGQVKIVLLHRNLTRGISLSLITPTGARERSTKVKWPIYNTMPPLIKNALQCAAQEAEKRRRQLDVAYLDHLRSLNTPPNAHHVAGGHVNERERVEEERLRKEVEARQRGKGRRKKEEEETVEIVTLDCGACVEGVYWVQVLKRLGQKGDDAFDAAAALQYSEPKRRAVSTLQRWARRIIWCEISKVKKAS